MFDWFKKAAPDSRPSDRPVQPEIHYLRSGVGVAIVSWSDNIAARQAMQHPIVYRALDKLASSVQQVEWFAELDPNADPKEREGKQTFVKALNGLLASPNPDLTAAQLRYWMALNYACYGRVPLKFSTSLVDSSKPNGIYPLEARLVKGEQDARGVIARFSYGEGDTKQVWPSHSSWAASGQTGARGYVAEIWKPGLKGFQHHCDNNTALSTVGLPSQVIRQLLIRAVQTASGHPNVRYLVMVEKTLTDRQKAVLNEHLNGDHAPSGEEAGKIPILQTVGKIEIHKLDNDLSDIHSKMPSDDMARLIFGAFGIPIALAGMGAADGAKFAGNYQESRLAFWEDTLIPSYIQPLFQGLTKSLCLPGVRISPNYDSIPAIMKGRISSMKEAGSIGFLTTDEKRELFGWAKTTVIPQVQSAQGNKTNEQQ
ncbi:MAG: phage portal protein [Beijerinckiaceae bacterium]